MNFEKGYQIYQYVSHVGNRNISQIGYPCETSLEDEYNIPRIFCDSFIYETPSAEGVVCVHSEFSEN